MRRWEGGRPSSTTAASARAARALLEGSGRPPAAPPAPTTAANDPAPLEPGDMIRVYVDPRDRVVPEGMARLIARRTTVYQLAAPLEYWDVMLETCVNAYGHELRVPCIIQRCSRAVHPADRLARAVDVAASSPATTEQPTLGLFVEDSIEERRR